MSGKIHQNVELTGSYKLSGTIIESYWISIASQRFIFESSFRKMFVNIRDT